MVFCQRFLDGDEQKIKSIEYTGQTIKMFVPLRLKKGNAFSQANKSAFCFAEKSGICRVLLRLIVGCEIHENIKLLVL